MMRKIFVKIRGIYSTALTKLLIDNNRYSVVRPSRQIQKRFKISENNVSEDISIQDREDHQGVRISGDEENLNRLITLFKTHFFDMVIREGAGIWSEKSPYENYPLPFDDNLMPQKAVEVEFPGSSKGTLDSLRARITPTVKNHHRFKIIASELVDLAEKELRQYPFRQTELEKWLREQIVLRPMKENQFIGLIHVRPEGKVLSLHGGKILSLEDTCLVIKRVFSDGHGQYDGLDLPIEKGDYGVTEVIENQWFLKHTYYSHKGSIKGSYWNINTPIEFYPDHIRYVDLHIDVIQKPGDLPEAIDQKKLEKASANGLISKELALKAYEIARSLIHLP